VRTSLVTTFPLVHGGRVVLAVSMFLISLQTYYFYELGLAPFPLVGLGLLALYALTQFAKESFHLVTLSWRIFAVFVVALVLSGMIASLAEELPLLPARLVTPIVALIAAVGVQVTVKRDPRGLMVALRFVVAVHVAFFLLQFFVFLATGYMIDFLAPITGEEQRVWSGDYTAPIMVDFARCSGLFNEPGTYANFVFPAYLAMRALMEERSKDQSWGWLDAVVIATVILSFSMYGVLFVLIWVLVGLSLRFSWLKLLIGIGIVFFAWVVAGEYVLERFAREDADAGGLGFRAEIAGRLYESMSAARFLWGYGFLSDLSSVFPDLVLNDIGLIFYTFVVGGAIAVLLLLAGLACGAMLAIRERLSLVFVVLASKLSLTFPFFWILVFILAAPRPSRDIVPMKPKLRK
jgi:hypothetical protein